MLRGILESSGGNTGQSHSGGQLLGSLPCCTYTGPGMWTGTRTHGTTLWAKLAEDLDLVWS